MVQRLGTPFAPGPANGGALMSRDLAKEAADRGICYFLISFVDLFGVLRAKLVPAAAIAQMQRDGAAFAGFSTHLDLTPPIPTCSLCRTRRA